MRFSVVVPFLNEERWLGDCLSALRKQTLSRERFELLFVDNGSSDRSAEIVRRSGLATLLQEPRRDPYIARNRGIAAAQGEYVVFLDADCIAEPGWLAELNAEVDRSHPDIVLGYLAHPANAPEAVRDYEGYYDCKLRYLIEGNHGIYFFSHAGNMAVRRDLFRELGDFLPMPVVGDTEIIHRALAWNPSTLLTYARRARVVHAEVTSMGVLLGKLYECGAYSETYAGMSRYRTLPFAERLRVLRRYQAARDAGLVTLCGLFLTLGLGWISFAAGRAVRYARIRLASSD